jgi:hypothetical protein
MIIEWTEDTVIVCAHCDQKMFPNISTWDYEDGGGCAWNCMTYGCGDWSGSEIEAEDLVALGVPYWIAERVEALSNAVSDLEE